ncbi:Complex I assembly factor TIMMDC1, mitochondrial [Merluccius polli]|uniref:Complex I assembly factor TIMMDC1, mitochondrial n=1 Tax=Merluccius polli TaxID=89951 RepID=A0AA47NQV6_MERPO|nr:Complex I assembly factor TIMMDC1, mitochondrial [Merluccius polli]
MGPQQAGVVPASRRRADSGPRGVLGAGLLRGLFQRAGPRTPSFCAALLPRVHAADAASAQTASSPSSPSPSSSPSTASSANATPAATPAPTGSTLPNNLGRPDFPDTGWDRVRDLFDRDGSRGQSEELSSVLKSGLAGALVGLFHGGLPAARHARQRYIQLSQAELYTSRVEAVRSSHNAAIRGFLRYGWRWSWRVAAFVMLFNSVSTGLSVYRDRDALSHYAAAGAATGGLFRLSLGLRGLVAGTLIGSLLGLPAGVLVVSMQTVAGETARDRSRRQRTELYQLKLQEWSARLQLTDELIGDLSVNTMENQDLQKIQQLLDLPRNEGPVGDAEDP